MKRLTLILALCLAACATDGAAPTLYGQGVPVAPRPPAFNPVTDAPITIGQPGHMAQPKNYPRGTDKRILPPTKEPTIFASDNPRASAGTAVRLFNLPIVAPKTREQRAETARCADRARIAFKEAEYVGRDPAWLKCFANVLAKACLDAEKDNIQRRIDANAAQPFDRERLAAISSAAEFAAKESQRICPDPLDPETTAGYNAMFGFISKIKWGPK